MKNLKISAAVMTVVFGWSIVGWSETAPVPVAAEKTVPVPASEKAAAPVASAATSKTEKTQHDFEDLLVQGKYHFSDEAVTTVEEDKVLDSLLGIRTDFKDKIEQSAGRY